jgi:hypothetical protein
LCEAARSPVTTYLTNYFATTSVWLLPNAQVQLQALYQCCGEAASKSACLLQRLLACTRDTSLGPGPGEAGRWTYDGKRADREAPKYPLRRLVTRAEYGRETSASN